VAQWAEFGDSLYENTTVVIDDRVKSKDVAFFSTVAHLRSHGIEFILRKWLVWPAHTRKSIEVQVLLLMLAESDRYGWIIHIWSFHS